MKATVDFIQKEKGDAGKVTLIGFSEGTSTSVFALSEYPEYFHEKVDLFVGLATVIYLKHTNEPILERLAGA